MEHQRLSNGTEPTPQCSLKGKNLFVLLGLFRPHSSLRAQLEEYVSQRKHTSDSMPYSVSSFPGTSVEDNGKKAYNAHLYWAIILNCFLIIKHGKSLNNLNLVGSRVCYSFVPSSVMLCIQCQSMGVHS